MKQRPFQKLTAIFLCIAVITALLLTGCVEEIETTTAPAAQSGVLGEGETVFHFSVIGSDGTEEEFEIHTNKTTVGEALMEVGLVEGEDSEYGLYVKTVNGETLDYDTDGKYWAFYINDSYAMTGVDETPIEADTIYAFKAES